MRAAALIVIAAMVGACEPGRQPAAPVHALTVDQAAATAPGRGGPTASRWPNQPGGFVPITDQPWSRLVLADSPARLARVAARVRALLSPPPAGQPDAWSYRRRSSSRDDAVVRDASAPLSPPDVLGIVFTPDMKADHEPSVHWIGLPGLTEIYTGWWMRVSPDWTCSPAGCGKIGFLFTGGAGQVYTNLYHSGNQAAPYFIGANTEWSPYGQRVWTPNVATTPVNPGSWHRVEFYYRWETQPGVSGDGVIRWWVDGVLNGDHRSVHYPASTFIEFQYAPTRQHPPPAEQYLFIDHTYISAPGAPMVQP